MCCASLHIKRAIMYKYINVQLCNYNMPASQLGTLSVNVIIHYIMYLYIKRIIYQL